MLSVFILSLSLSFAAKPPAQTAGIHVVAYHTFLGKKNVPTDFSVEELREHMTALKEKGFRFVTMSDIMKGNVSGNRNIMITIDDGNKSVRRAYDEVFRPMGIKPMLAIYPNIIGRVKYALNWDELRALEREGCEIAAHGFYHLPLKEKLYRTKKKDFTNEIVKSRKVLEEKLGKPIRYFVYPSGVTCDEAIELIKKEGFLCAFTITWGAMKAPLEANPKPYELPRYMLVKENWKNVFALFERRSGGDRKKKRVRYVKELMVMKSGG